MRVAIISDVHANLEALEAVLDVIDGRGADAVCCTGDLVGYGADPAACVDLVRERCAVVVRGNHDDAVGMDRNLDQFPKDAQAALLLHRAALPEAHRAYLAGLPSRADAFGCLFVHATPETPALWRRISSYPVAAEQFDRFEEDVCFLGHSHVPAVVANQLGLSKVRPGYRFLINVGSVGQPRDFDTRACVGFFDTEAFGYDLVRVPYDVERASQKVVDAGLPASLADRLRIGR